jgi:hypothetical protein
VQADDFGNREEVKAKARTKGFSTPFLTQCGSTIPDISFSFQRERKKLPS